MERYLARNAAEDPEGYLRASIDWLAARGGGSVIAELRSNLEDALDMMPGEFDRYVKLLSSQGIELTWRRRRVPSSGDVVAAFTTRGMIEELEEKERLNSLMVLGWSERDFREWESEFDPVQIELGGSNLCLK